MGSGGARERKRGRYHRVARRNFKRKSLAYGTDDDHRDDLSEMLASTIQTFRTCFIALSPADAKYFVADVTQTDVSLAPLAPPTLAAAAAAAATHRGDTASYENLVYLWLLYLTGLRFD